MSPSLFFLKKKKTHTGASQNILDFKYFLSKQSREVISNS